MKRLDTQQIDHKVAAHGNYAEFLLQSLKADLSVQYTCASVQYSSRNKQFKTYKPEQYAQR